MACGVISDGAHEGVVGVGGTSLSLYVGAARVVARMYTFACMCMRVRVYLCVCICIYVCVRTACVGNRGRDTIIYIPPEYYIDGKTHFLYLLVHPGHVSLVHGVEHDEGYEDEPHGYEEQDHGDGDDCFDHLRRQNRGSDQCEGWCLRCECVYFNDWFVLI